MRDDYDKAYKEYASIIDESRYISDEIWEKVNQERDEHYKLERYKNIFISDYLPLANNDESVAINFLDKAYKLTDEQKDYVLKNYKKSINGAK